MKILHGEDLMISVNGVTELAAKTCTIKINTSEQKKSSPTSGQWEEVVPGKMSWSVETNHLVYAGTQPTLSQTNIFYLNAISNTEGWRVLGECEATVSNSTQLNIIDERGSINEGIYVLKIAKQNGTLAASYYIATENWAELSTCLQEQFSSTDYIFVIATVGKYAINRATCVTLDSTYHVALPFVELGGIINNEEVLVDIPLIMMGGKGITQGMCAYGQAENIIKATFYNGVLPTANGLTGFTSMVGKICTLRMRNADDGTIITGQALCKVFNVNAAKNALMKGEFSWRGNGELRTSAFVPTTKTLEPYVNYITIDMSKQIPSEMITGDVNGNIIQQIRSSFHRYVALMDSGTLKICQLNDENSALFPDGTEAKIDGTRGDVFVKHATFYTQVVNYGGGRFRIGFAERNLGTGWKEWNENDMIGAYEASATTAKNSGDTSTANFLRSISGVTPIGGIAVGNYASLATAMGSGFTTIKMRHHNLMGVLLMVISGTTNSQAMYGNGAASTMTTGGTNGLGTRDTDAIAANMVNFCGLENWWGSQYEYINNVEIHDVSRNWRITDGGTTRTVQGLYIDDRHGFFAKVALGENLDLIPTELQPGIGEDYRGDSQQGFCDWIDGQSNGEDTYGILRSGGGSDSKYGAFYLYNTIGSTSLQNESIGTRLCYQGTFQELTPTQYKALFQSY